MYDIRLPESWMDRVNISKGAFEHLFEIPGILIFDQHDRGEPHAIVSL